MDPIPAEEQRILGNQFAQLNAILEQKHKVQQEITALMAKAEELRRRAEELDEQFHKLAITIQPTIRQTIQPKKKPQQTSTSALVNGILSALEKGGPSVQEQINQLVNRYTGGTTT